MRRILFIVGALFLIGIATLLVWMQPDRDDIVAEQPAVSDEPMMVEVYFGNQVEDPQALDCNRVYPVTREISSRKAPAAAAVEVLLQGPTPLEQQSGYFTSIPAGTRLVGVTIEGATARAEFSPQLEADVAGACRVAAIRAEISQTLQQFDTVSRVEISVTGKAPETTLQP